MGLIKKKYLGVTINVYTQEADEELVAYALDWKVTKRLKDFNIPNATCLINSNYFVNTNTSDYGQILGRIQGMNINEAPNQDGWIDCVALKDGTLIIDNLNSWDYRDMNQVAAGMSVACVILRNGQAVRELSSAVGSAKYNNPNTQTLFGRMKNGQFVFAVVEDGLTGAQCTVFAREFGMTECVMLDSGGSSEMVVNDTRVSRTGGRRVPCCLAFVRTGNKVETDNKVESVPETNDEGNGTFYLNFSKSIYHGTNIRSSRSILSNSNKLGFARHRDNGHIHVQSCGYTPSDPKAQWCKTLQEVKLSNGKVAPEGSYIRFDHEEGSFIE